jgi:hypothetical protein
MSIKILAVYLLVALIIAPLWLSCYKIKGKND